MSDVTKQDATTSTAPTQPPASSPTDDYDITDSTLPLEPEPAPAPVAQTPPPAHAADLTQLAEKLGVKEDIEGMTPEQARTYVNRFAYRTIQRNDAENAANPTRNGEASPEAPTAPGAARHTSERAAPPIPESFLPEDDSVIDKDIAKLVNGVFRQMSQRISQLEGATNHLVGFEVQRQQRRVDGMLDKAFADLPPEYKAVVGDGRMRDLKDQGAKRSREAIVNAAKGLAGKDQSNEAVAAKIGDATRLLYRHIQATTAATPAQEQPAPSAPARPRDAAGRFTQEAWNNGATHTPTARTPGAEPPSMEKAKRTFLQGQRELDQRMNGSATAVADEEL